MPTVSKPPPDARKHYADSWRLRGAVIEFASSLNLLSALSRARLATLLVVCAGLVVHAAWAGNERVSSAVELPLQVAELRDLLLSAVHSGRLEDLQPAFEQNAGKPDLGFPGADDPIAALKRASADGQGLEALAAMGEILRLQPAALPLGKDIENNLIFVWPYLAERSLDRLNTIEQIDLLGLVPPAKAAEMREKKRWMWWRLVIGADGVWLSFKKSD